MSIEATKSQLISVFSDDDNRVVALSGKWGTGKSPLWREVRAASADAVVQSALYVSLFGLSDMNQIKLRIMQSALPGSEGHEAAWDRVRLGLAGLKKTLTAIHKGFSAIDELALLAVPSILKDRLIVLDDIERRHEKLAIEEVLGFIDEFTQQHGARFVLILNSDQLKQRESWDALREKVIDQELTLDTSTDEAFTIAVGLTPSRHGEAIRVAAKTCGLNNIRIIRKVIRAANRILDGHGDLPPAVLAQTIPSIVLLAAVSYKGIDGPDFEFVLARGSPTDWRHVKRGEERADDVMSEEEKKKAQWSLMLDELGIQYSDEFEVLVIEFLQSGLLDIADLSAIIEGYLANIEATELREAADRFSIGMVWDHRATEADLLAQARALVPRARMLDPYRISELAAQMKTLPGGEAIGEAAVAEWLAGFGANVAEGFDKENVFNREVHPLVKAAFDRVERAAQIDTTVFEACTHIVEHSGWGVRQEQAMRSATAADFEATIRELSVPDLRRFMRKMLELCVQKPTYVQHFGSAMDRFIEACRTIHQDANSPKLSALVQMLFRSARLEAELAVPGHAAADEVGR